MENSDNFSYNSTSDIIALVLAEENSPKDKVIPNQNKPRKHTGGFKRVMSYVLVGIICTTSSRRCSAG